MNRQSSQRSLEIPKFGILLTSTSRIHSPNMFSNVQVTYYVYEMHGEPGSVFSANSYKECVSYCKTHSPDPAAWKEYFRVEKLYSAFVMRF